MQNDSHRRRAASPRWLSLAGPAALSMAVLLTSCGGGGGSAMTIEPVVPPNPDIVAKQGCTQGSPYTVTLVNSAFIPQATLDRMVCTFVEAFPKVGLLLSNTRLPDRINIAFQGQPGYAAATAGNTITFDIDWVRAHPNDLDLLVHELTHIVQADRGSMPGWIVEGSATFMGDLGGLRSVDTRSEMSVRFQPGDRYQGGYGGTATFFRWVDALYRQGKPRVVEALYLAANTRQYSADLWTELTGKSLDALWDEYSTYPVAAAFTSGISLYLGPNYQGRAIRLERGRYDLRELLSLNVPDNAIASIAVPAGYKVTAYSGIGFTGDKVELTADTPMLEPRLLRTMSSLVVE